MKKILFVAAAALTAASASAQKANVSAAENAIILQQFDKAKESIDQALENEKTKDYAMTYIVAADVYTHLLSSDINNLKKAKEFMLEAERLNKVGNAKGKAIGKFTKDIVETYKKLVRTSEQEAANAYNAKNYAASRDAFIFDIWAGSQLPEHQDIADSSIIINVGLASMQAEDWNTGAEYFLKAGRMKVGGAMSFIRAKYCYEQLNDSANIEKSLKEGFEAYPEVTDMINTLINYYIQAQKNEEALVYLNDAIKRDPNNAQYFFARGCLMERSDSKEAIADYQRAIEISPENFGATYNLGVVYYNEALQKKTAASGERDNVKYNAMINESNETFKRAVPYFIKAAEIAPDKAQKREVLSNLQRTYYTIQEYTKSQEVKSQIDELDAQQ